jgi:hypothetical protein
VEGGRSGPVTRRLARLPLPNICPVGFVFIWAEKQVTKWFFPACWSARSDTLACGCLHELPQRVPWWCSLSQNELFWHKGRSGTWARMLHHGWPPVNELGWQNWRTQSEEYVHSAWPKACNKVIAAGLCNWGGECVCCLRYVECQSLLEYPASFL